MNSTIDLLCQHRSVRRYTKEPISEAQIAAISDAMCQSSSTCFLQCVSVIKIDNAELRHQLVALSGDQQQVEAAAEFWIFCADLERHRQIDGNVSLGHAEQLLFATIDTAIMAQNALTAAESLGLGGVFIGGLRNNIAEVTELLSLPTHVLPLFGLCLGHPAEKPDLKPRLPQKLMIFTDRYQPLDREGLAEYDMQMRDYYATRQGSKKVGDWSEHVAKQLAKEKRPFMLDYLQKQGWIKR